jgi:type I restriction enzyme, S subunit
MKFNKIKLKYIAKLNPPKSEINIIYDDKKDVSFLPMDKILGPNELDLSINKNIEEVYSGYTYFKENDIILAKVTPCFENGNIAIAKNLTNGVGFGTTELHVIRVNQNLYDNKFIYYCLQTEEFKSEAVSNMYGVGGLKRVPIEFLKEYKFLVPELEIQNKISRYLDCKINQINNLIKSKKRLI